MKTAQGNLTHIDFFQCSELCHLIYSVYYTYHKHKCCLVMQHYMSAIYILMYPQLLSSETAGRLQSLLDLFIAGVITPC